MPAEPSSSAPPRASKKQWMGDRGKLRVSTEILYCGLFYWLYSIVRNTQGSNRGNFQQSLTNAQRIIRWEKNLHIYVERGVQETFLSATWFQQIVNTYYGTAHFIVTFFAFAWCFKKMPERYRRFRNTIGVMTACALIGYAFFPLMPPRLLPRQYGYVDSLKVFGGPWSFDSGAVAKASNQYAAMPSMHFGWATWCVYTLWPWVGRAKTPLLQWLRRIVLLAYPMITLFVIVVTANHYILDAAGGAVAFLIGRVGGKWIDRAAIIDRIRLRKQLPEVEE